MVVHLLTVAVADALRLDRDLVLLVDFERDGQVEPVVVEDLLLALGTRDDAALGAREAAAAVTVAGPGETGVGGLARTRARRLAMERAEVEDAAAQGPGRRKVGNNDGG